MKTALPLLLLAASLIAFLHSGFARGASAAEEEIGMVRLGGSSSCLDARVRRALDSLVPRLAALDPGRIVMIEARAAWGRGREERVRNSYLLALEAQRHLRAKLASGRIMYLASASGGGAGGDTFVRVVSLPDSFAAVHVATAGSRRPQPKSSPDERPGTLPVPGRD
uniref:Uncharacterized protein n=1 Tax=Geobacter metallireducens TaxID=28232 RepID=A0A831XFG8_GEOME